LEKSPQTGDQLSRNAPRDGRRHPVRASRGGRRYVLPVHACMYRRTHRPILGPGLVRTNPYRHEGPRLDESVRLLASTRTAHCCERKAASPRRSMSRLVASSNHELVTAHQSIVTASFLADSTKGDLAFQTSKWLHRQIQDDQSRLKPGTLLLLAWHRHDPEDCTMRDIFKRFGGLKSRDVRIFLSTYELDHAQEKLGDIRALDQIADYAPDGWSFRPVTCDNMSECLLGVNGVLKRTHSCGSDHVILRPTASDVSRHLQCLSRRRRMSNRRTCQSIGRWFHQEFVEDLVSRGEFRVFVITREDISALRKRRGIIMEIIHTLELLDKELAVTVLHPNLA